jgi:hypothetical protein
MTGSQVRDYWTRTENCVRLPALMDLYIHPLYVLVSKILFSILNSPVPIYHLYHPLSTLSTMGSTCHFYLNVSMCDLVLNDLLRRI